MAMGCVALSSFFLGVQKPAPGPKRGGTQDKGLSFGEAAVCARRAATKSWHEASPRNFEEAAMAMKTGDNCTIAMER